jgi:type VI secretion system secreted protein Hcp
MAFQFHVAIKGQTQGQFKGEGIQDKRKDKWMPGLGFAYELKSPRDIATGQASGKRQHGPIKFIKEWGAATPQIFTACATNEVLPEVNIEFTKTNPNGEEYVYHTIKLTNATVSDIRQFTESTDGAGRHTLTSKTELEEVSFTFQKIEVQNTDGKTMFMDDWQAHS